MAGSHRGPNKERFYPWLMKQINSSRYPGLVWLDDAHTRFRVPWKDFKSKDLHEEDYGIFKSWATHSGKYSEAVFDPGRWKTNFYNALKSITVDGEKVFTKIDDSSGRAQDPHKVFKINHIDNPQATEDQLTAPNRGHFGGITRRDQRGQNNEKNGCSRLTQTIPAQDLIEDVNSMNLMDPLPDETIFNIHCRGLRRLAPKVPVMSRSKGNQPEETSFYTLAPPLNNHTLTQRNTVRGDLTCAPAAFLQEPLRQSQTHPLAVAEHLHQAAQGAPARSTASGNTWHQPAEDREMANWWACSRNIPEETSFYLAEDRRTNTAAPLYGISQNIYTSPTEALAQNPLQHTAVMDQQQITASAVQCPSRKRARSYDSYGENEDQEGKDPLDNKACGGAEAAHGRQDIGMDALGPVSRPPAQCILDAANSLNPGDLFTCLELSIYYRWKDVLRQDVNHSKFLLNYNRKVSSLGNINAVHFPSPCHLPDRKQVQLTVKVLEAMRKGLLLEVHKEQKKIYAKWLGSSGFKVFWASANHLARLESSPDPECLQKEVATEIFNFNTFLRELEEYYQGRGSSPNFTIYMCFGQQFTVKKPKEEKLVLVKIVPRFCVFWYEFVQRRGASSLNSLTASLQISSSSTNSLYDLIESASFGDYQQTCWEQVHLPV
ncbi:interferon regulatory factor 3-like isoform X1 [Lissotriton helveticus]